MTIDTNGSIHGTDGKFSEKPQSDVLGGNTNLTMGAAAADPVVVGVAVECSLEDPAQRAKFYEMAQLINEAGFAGTVTNSLDVYTEEDKHFTFKNGDGEFRFLAHPDATGIMVSAAESVDYSMVTGRGGHLHVQTIREHLGGRIESTRAFNSLEKSLTQHGLEEGFDSYRGEWASADGDAKILGFSPAGWYDDHAAMGISLSDADDEIEYQFRSIDGHLEVSRNDKVLPSWEARSVCSTFDERLPSPAVSTGTPPTLSAIFESSVAGLKR